MKQLLSCFFSRFYTAFRSGVSVIASKISSRVLTILSVLLLAIYIVIIPLHSFTFSFSLLTLSLQCGLIFYCIGVSSGQQFMSEVNEIEEGKNIIDRVISWPLVLIVGMYEMLDLIYLTLTMFFFSNRMAFSIFGACSLHYLAPSLFISSQQHSVFLCNSLAPSLLSHQAA